MYISELPECILDKIFSYLTYKETKDAGTVCPEFHEAAKRHISDGTFKVLTAITLKMRILQDYMNTEDLKQETKITFNQMFTALNIIQINFYSLFVLNRNGVNGLADTIDEIFEHLNMMFCTISPPWYEQCANLQNLLASDNLKDTILKNNQPQSNFGLYVMDILDLMLGLNYEIVTIYNIQKNQCNITACYYTDEIKFLSYLPETSLLVDCKDRTIQNNEWSCILKYLLLLLNFHNGLLCKAEEAVRERTFGNKEHVKDFKHLTLPRAKTCRTFLDANKVSETYVKNINGASKEGALLSCELWLQCNLDCAPYQIARNYGTLQSELGIQNADTGPIEDDVYTCKIRLRADLRCKNMDCFEMIVKDGKQFSNE